MAGMVKQEHVKDEPLSPSVPLSPVRSISSPEGLESTNGGMEEDLEPATKLARLSSSRLYGCPHCPYVNARKPSLNRHLRIHSSSHVVADDRFCHDCKIQFSSLKTFKAHKEQYCQGRQTFLSSSPNLPYLCLPTSPIILVPYSIIQNAQILPHMSLPNCSAFIVSPDGVVRNLSVLSPNSDDGPHPKHPTRSSSSPTNQSSTESDTPLDLSTKRQDGVSNVDKPHFNGSINSPVDSNPQPSSDRPGSTGEAEGSRESPFHRLPFHRDEGSTPFHRDMSPRAENPVKSERTSSPEENNTTGSNSVTNSLVNSLWPLSNPTSMAFLFPHLAGLNLFPPPTLVNGVIRPQATPPPSVLIKQGVSKCKECNIVFYKHENYLAHKKHYCASRESSSEETRVPEESSPESLQTSSKPLLQFICTACGIKFTSPDNLKAHQTFYCPKRGLREDESRDSGMDPPFHCLRCGYRGHTMRGIRAHIRTHSLDGPEEQYIASGVPVMTDPESNHKGKVFSCEVCTYSSSYKGNVQRHCKLAHKMDDGSSDTEGVETQVVSPATVKQTPSPEPEAANPPKKPGAKYCKSCDISFTYLSSFIAHKKYYCASHVTENNQTESAPP